MPNVGNLNVQVLEIISQHVGQDYAITAGEIATIIGVSDHEIRQVVKDLRKEGTLILSTRWKGYFMPENHDEWEAFRNEYLRPRAMEILQMARAMAQTAQERWGAREAEDDFPGLKRVQ
jgi:biotin operon repressor